MKLYHAAVAIIFNSQGQILLSRRYEPNSKHSHNKLQFPGGGIEADETPQQAVIREVKEEANIEIELLSSDPFLRLEQTSRKNIKIQLYGFPAIYVSGTISCENDPESSDIGWFNYEDVDFELAFSGTKELVDEALKLWKKL